MTPSAAAVAWLLGLEAAVVVVCLLGLLAATAWRLRGLWKRLRGSRDWGVMTRRGFATGAPP